MIDLHYLLDAAKGILPFVPVTLLISITAMIFSIILGLVMAVLRRQPNKIIASLAGLYVSLFRGFPTVVQLFIVYFGLPQLFPAFNSLDALYAVILTFSFKESAYLTEIFRAGLDSVDKGQIEAGLAVGMKKWKIYQEVVLPQAIVNALPGTTNVFVSLIKESSLAFTLGITELFAQGKLMASSNLRYFETYLTVGLMYWALIIIVGRLAYVLEKHLSKAYKR
ncbi:amino acid ABC transporter permease [Jeotgalibaca arthritidis]|uniref:Amino acid ABC transporter permease n=1 Tax=Jeotgalibaca arthritidis TaxID=1868794 RepID=A0A6G7K880_9LACT|nr:amino acid ABC transporter permease [Jeotgalibaca arthritidis]QII81447.1 amino acid ABC transporter permease [Jeotgalibaca arthritidis]